MPSPFPGMDPFLEHPEIIPDLHSSLNYCLREAIQAQLLPRDRQMLESVQALACFRARRLKPVFNRPVKNELDALASAYTGTVHSLARRACRPVQSASAPE